MISRCACLASSIQLFPLLLAPLLLAPLLLAPLLPAPLAPLLGSLASFATRGLLVEGTPAICFLRCSFSSASRCACSCVSCSHCAARPAWPLSLNNAWSISLSEASGNRFFRLLNISVPCIDGAARGDLIVLLAELGRCCIRCVAAGLLGRSACLLEPGSRSSRCIMEACLLVTKGVEACLLVTGCCSSLGVVAALVAALMADVAAVVRGCIAERNSALLTFISPFLSHLTKPRAVPYRARHSGILISPSSLAATR